MDARMTPEKWQKIDELYQEAIALPPSQRRDFLLRACADDEEIRREVESLLAVKSAAAGFFDRTAYCPTVYAPIASAVTEDCNSLKAVANGADRNAGSGSGRWFVRIAAIGLAAAFILQLLMSGFLLKYISKDRFGVLWERKPEGMLVAESFPESPAAGKLQKGDRLLSINGENRFSRTYPEEILRRIAPGEPCRMQVQRGTEELSVEISSESYPYFNLRRVRYSVTGLVRGPIYLLVALLILILKRNDRFALIGVAAFWSLVMLNLKQMMYASRYMFTGWENWIHLPILLLYGGQIFIPIIFHMAVLFPPGSAPPLTSLWKSLRALLYFMAAFLTILAWLNSLAPHSATVASILFAHDYRLYNLYRDAAVYIFPFGSACIFAAITRNYLAANTPDQRRRMKLVVIGTAMAAISAALFALMVLAEQRRLLSQVYDGALATFHEPMAWFVDFATVVMAVAWAYAILTRRVYDVRVVIRRGLRYLLARNVLRVVLLAPVFVLLYRIFSEPNQTIKALFIHQPLSILLIVLVSLSLYFRQRLQHWLDKRFFREQYDQEQILYRLIDEIKEFDHLPELCHLVGDQLNMALHPSHISLLFRQPDSSELQLVYSSNPTGALHRLCESSMLFQMMRSLRTMVAFPLPPEVSLPQSEVKLVQKLRIELLTPALDSDDQLIGLLLLGEKMSEEPYSPTDRRLLLAIARQMGTVFEVARLREQIERKAKSERDVLARLRSESVDLLRECPQCGRCFGAAHESCADCGCDLMLTLPVGRTIANRY